MNTRLSLFDSPMFLGFDHFEETFNRLRKSASDGYPPYNIEQTHEHGLRISLAVAGFTMDDLEVEVERNQLVIRVGKDIMVMADAQDTDPYVSFDMAAEKVAKQLRRYKKRLRDHHERLEEDTFTKTQNYVIAAENNAKEGEQEPEHKDPVIVAEMSSSIQTMSVSEAVMRLDLSGDTALLFRNAHHSGINMIYRRQDGNVGWVDPEGNESTAAKKAANA